VWVLWRCGVRGEFRGQEEEGVRCICIIAHFGWVGWAGGYGDAVVLRYI